MSKRGARRDFWRMLMACWAVLLPFQTMANDGLGFYEVCHHYLPLAEGFAAQCLAHAREQTRYFNGEPERHSVYFYPDPLPSHFGLGCTLGWSKNGQGISYLGLYYSTHPENFKLANTAAIRFIDFEGNVGLAVDDEPVTLVAVRRFVTPSAPLPWPTKPLNCEGENDGPTQPIYIPQGYYSYSERKSGKDVEVRWCEPASQPPLCSESRYIKFFSSSESKTVFDYIFHPFLIQADGGLLIDAKTYNDACYKYYDRRMATPNLAQELCPQSPRSSGQR